jgi:hypothetical protein
MEIGIRRPEVKDHTQPAGVGYLQSGQQPAPMRRVAADALAATVAAITVASARIVVFI